MSEIDELRAEVEALKKRVLLLEANPQPKRAPADMPDAPTFEAIRRFVAERCDIGPGLKIDRPALRSAYESWATDSGVDAATAKAWTRALRALGFTDLKGVHRTHNFPTRGWRGIALKA